MSDQFNRGGKNDGNRKYQSINLSQHFNKRDSKAAAKSTTGRGLQSLGKVGVSTRRLPRPAVCSSLKKENAGNDPNVALVPGGGGWGSKKESSQVEVTEGEKGWKEVEDKPASKNLGFSQEFPSLGEDAPSSQRLELRPQTVKWGEKQAKQPSNNEPLDPASMQPVAPNAMHPMVPPIPMPINQTFGVVQVPMSPMYGMVPVPGPIYPGMSGAVYRPIYPPVAGTPPHLYPAAGTPPTAPLPMPYMYTAPPPVHGNDDIKPDVNEKLQDKSPTKGPDHWGDDVQSRKVETPDAPQMGFISPYTQPFPGIPGKLKQTEEVRAEPIGKPSEEKRITYHGRTSSHSSLSEPPEDDLSHELEEKLDLNKESTPRVISRSIAKKELKAFPKEEELEAKSVLHKSEQEEVSASWEDDELENDKSASVWEERQKVKDGNVWNIPRSAAEGAPAPSSSDRYFDDDFVSERNESPQYIEKPPQLAHQGRRDRHDMRNNRDRSDQITTRRFMDNSQRKALEDASNCINNMPQTKHPEPKKQITIQQKPKVEILQKPAMPAAAKPAPVQSSGAPTSNYWQDKQAERDRQEAEEERKRREQQKAEAQKARQQQYQDYRTPDEYNGTVFDDEKRQQYDEEREAEREKRSIRRRGHDEFYDNDTRYEKPERTERRPRRNREEVFRIEYREPRGSRESRSSREIRHPRDSRDNDRKRHDSHEQKYDSRDQRSESRDVERYDSRERRSDTRDPREDRRVDSRKRYNDRYNCYDDPDRFYYERAEVRERPKRQERSKKPVQSESKDEPTPVPIEDIKAEVVPDQIEDTVESNSTEAPEEELEPKVDAEDKIDVEPKQEKQKVSREKSSRDQDRYDRERRDPRERYDRERYERPDFTTYRREPRSMRGERPRDSRRDDTRREYRSRQDRDPKDYDGVVKSEDKKPVSKQKARVEKYKSEIKERRTKSERRSRRPREGEEWVSSDEQRSKSQSTKSKPRPTSEQHVEPSDENSEKQEKSERPKRAHKTPSVRYYSANPADRLKPSQSVPPKATNNDEKPKERAPRAKSDVRSKEIKKEPKKDTTKKETAETKPAEAPSKIKTKDPAAEAKKAKKIEKTKFEMDRLKRMTQSGMDLLTLGIYAVDGKELDDHEAADYSEGFVEVVRKKSKKEPEIEKKPTTTKSKKSKKSSTSKTKKAPISQEEAKQVAEGKQATAPPTSASSTSPIDKLQNPAAVKSWTASTAVDLPLMSSIWSNPKKNAWDKPLTFTEKQISDTRDILAPISGESTSLFSSDADLAKKTKEKNWRGAETRPPRFSKAPEKVVVSKTLKNEKKKKLKEELVGEEVEEKDIQLPSIPGSALDLIPPVVEDLFGIRSDSEDDSPSLSSLVLETKVTVPVVAPPVVGLPQRERVPPPVPPTEHTSSEELNESSNDTETSPDLMSAETSTQTTPPAPRPLEETQVTPLSVGETSPPRPPPSLNPAVKQLITSTSALSLTDQLREIGQAQLAAQQLQQADRSQFFAMQTIQSSPLMQSLQNSPGLHPESPLVPQPQPQPPPQQQQPPQLQQQLPQQQQQLPQQPLLGHFITPATPAPDLSPHIMPSAHQMAASGSNTSLPLMGSHPISSPLSSLGNIGNRPSPATATDFFKNYISPMSPTNKIYPVSNQNFVNQNIHQFMSNQLMTNHSSTNYASPSMSPIPSQINPFAQFHQKSSSPKLQNLYTSPQGSFDALDPTGMMSFTQQLQKPTSSGLTNQQLFYQSRMMPGQEIYYKLKPSDNILLQSDMSKHVDAKPFNPGGSPSQSQRQGGNPSQPQRPGMFKPEFLQHVMQPNGPLPHNGGYKQMNPAFEKDVTAGRPQMLQRPITSDFSAINGLMQQSLPSQPSIQRVAPAALFPQHSNRQDATAFLQQQAVAAAKTANQMARCMPRVKLARDGRLHRLPDMRSKFSSLIPPSVQQHMQQQSLAQIQQYQAEIARGEDRAKETLPDNMKPAATSPIKPPPAEKVELSSPVNETSLRSPAKEQNHSPIALDKLPKSPVKSEVAPVEKIIVEEEPSKKTAEPIEEEKGKKAEKRKHSDTRNSYRRRNYGYPTPPDYDYYDGYHEERYHDRYHDDRYYDDRRPDDRYHDDRHHYRGGGPRTGRYPPPPLYRGYPPPPPRDYRRGAHPPHRHRY